MARRKLAASAQIPAVQMAFVPKISGISGINKALDMRPRPMVIVLAILVSLMERK